MLIPFILGLVFSSFTYAGVFNGEWKSSKNREVKDDVSLMELYKAYKPMIEELKKNLKSSEKKKSFWFLVSFSLTEDDLKRYGEQIKLLKDKGVDIKVVFRGFNPSKETFSDFIRKVNRIFADKGIEVLVEPRMFDVIGIDFVPALVYSEQKGCEKTFKDKKGYLKLREKGGNICSLDRKDVIIAAGNVSLFALLEEVIHLQGEAKK